MVLRKLIFPWGLTLKPASDRVGTKIARAMMEPGATRERLTRGMYLPKEETDAVGVLAHALEAVLATEPLEQKLRKLARDGQFKTVTARERLAEALRGGVLSQAEFDVSARAQAQARRDHGGRFRQDAGTARR